MNRLKFLPISIALAVSLSGCGVVDRLTGHKNDHGTYSQIGIFVSNSGTTSQTVNIDLGSLKSWDLAVRSELLDGYDHAHVGIAVDRIDDPAHVDSLRTAGHSYLHTDTYGANNTVSVFRVTLVAGQYHLTIEGNPVPVVINVHAGSRQPVVGA